MRLILSLYCLCSTSFASTPAQPTKSDSLVPLGNFGSPGVAGERRDYTQNPHWPKNSTQTVQWNWNANWNGPEIPRAYSLYLYQDITNGSFFEVNRVFQRTLSNPDVDWISWKVDPGNSTVDIPFFFYLKCDVKGLTAYSFVSHYFNITEAVLPPSSTSSVSITAPTASDSLYWSSKSSSNSKPVALGVGLGIGIPIVLLLCVFAGVRILKVKRGDTGTAQQEEAPGPESTSEKPDAVKLEHSEPVYELPEQDHFVELPSPALAKAGRVRPVSELPVEIEPVELPSASLDELSRS